MQPKIKMDKYMVASIFPGSIFMILFILRSSFQLKSERVFTLFDDAMISMGYAKTLARTGELVWFPGAEKVEGITNLLWTIWMTVLHMTGLEGSQVSLAISLTSLGLILSTSILGYKCIENLLSSGNHRHSRILPALGSLIIPFLYPLTYWSLRGMETGLLALVLLALVYVSTQLGFERDTLASQKTWVAKYLALCTVGILTRIDFFLPVVIVTLYLLYRASSKSKRKLFLGILVYLIFVLLAILLWQYLYYGDALTNTYRLKVGGVGVETRLQRGLQSSAKFLPLLALLGYSHQKLKDVDVKADIKSFSRISLGSVIVVFCYSIWAGGDAWEFMGINRYLAITLPLVVVTLIINCYSVRHSIGPASVSKYFILWAFVAIFSACLAINTNPFGVQIKVALFALFLGSVLVISFFVFLPFHNLKSKSFLAHYLLAAIIVVNFTPGLNFARYGFQPFYVKDDFQITLLSKELTNITTTSARIAVSWAGTPGYYSERKMVDLLGKSDRKIANQLPKLDLPVGQWNRDFYPGHNKFDYDYSIGILKPDIVVDLVIPADLTYWGYSEYCTKSKSKIFVQSSSSKVYLDKISRCGFLLNQK